jgi:preprotein translocase subunit SecY
VVKNIDNGKSFYKIEQLKDEKENIRYEYDEYVKACMITVIFFGTMSISVGLVDNLFVKCTSLILFTLLIGGTFMLYFRPQMSKKRKELDDVKKKLQDEYKKI